MNNNTIYQKIAERVTEMLQNGIIPWKRPYECGMEGHLFAWSHATGEDYSFLNCMILKKPGEYWTFDQARRSGLKVKKGAKAEHVYFWKILDKTEMNEDGEMTGYKIPFLKQYPVFHESDIEGAPERVPVDVDKTLNAEPIAAGEEILSRYFSMENAPLFNLKDCIPHYSPTKDIVEVPDRYRFTTREDFYDTLFHEMIHSTGHAKRLNRLCGIYGTPAYAKEELVAEMGAARLSQICGFNEKLSENSASYCAYWMKKLENNIEWFVWAASRADAAVNYIIGK